MDLLSYIEATKLNFAKGKHRINATTPGPDYTYQRVSVTGKGYIRLLRFRGGSTSWQVKVDDQVIGEGIRASSINITTECPCLIRFEQSFEIRSTSNTSPLYGYYVLD